MNKFLFSLLVPLMFLSLNSCRNLEKDVPYNIYWIHLEGAPLRTFFDQWIDPFNLFQAKRPEVSLESFEFQGTNYFLPKVWSKKNKPSPLLQNWASIRGIEVSSPHLKEGRKEWMSPLLTFKEAQVYAANPRLKEIYEQIFEKQINVEVQGLSQIFGRWTAELDTQRNTEGSLKVFILDGDHEADFSFENNTTLNDKNLQNYEAFYQKFLRSLENFSETLKKRHHFGRTVILLTSDRNRIVTSDSSPYSTTSLWQGLNFSLLSGAIKGPLVLGHIQREHPEYKETLPGTWGLASDPKGIKEFYQLISELLVAPKFIRTDGNYAKNPWFAPQMLQNLKAKQNPGRVL